MSNEDAMTHTADNDVVSEARSSKWKRIYGKLAEEGGGTWATYMMMEIDELLSARTSTAPVARKPELGTPEYRDMLNRHGYEKWPAPDASQPLAQPVPSVVTVKPLAWQEHTDGGEWYSDDDPSGDNRGLYWIRASNINPGEWDLYIVNSREDSYRTPDLAKAAAQADYSARHALATGTPAETTRAEVLREAARIARHMQGQWADQHALAEASAVGGVAYVFERMVDGYVPLANASTTRDTAAAGQPDDR